MIVAEKQPEIRVDANTRVHHAGVDWFPRRNIDTGIVCWFYGPRLARNVEKASPWCSADARRNLPMCLIPNEILSTDLRGGEPCPDCDAKWSLT